MKRGISVEDEKGEEADARAGKKTKARNQGEGKGSRLLYWEWEQCGDAGAAMPLLFSRYGAWERPGEAQF